MSAASTPRIVDVTGRPISAADTAYFAANTSARELYTWNPALMSADDDLLDEQGTIVSRSRDLTRNHGVAAGVQQTYADNIVGTGLRLSSKPDYRLLGRTKEWATEWATNVEALWRTFADSMEFDAARSMNFGQMTAQQFMTWFNNGEILALPLWLPRRPGAKWSTCIQSVDPDRLSNPHFMPNNARLRSGVEINNLGEAIAYYVQKTHPGSGLTSLGEPMEWERIPARTNFGRLRVIHGFRRERPGQNRGRPIMAPIMGSFRMLDHYQRTELQSAVVTSMIAAFIETPLTGDQVAEMFGGSVENYLTDRSEHTVKLQGGAVLPLYPGDKLSPFTPQRNSQAFAAFVESMLRHISAGLNIPYELLYKDFSKTTYSSARAALLEAWRFFITCRHWLSTYWAQPIFELWLEEAVNAGLVDAPDFYENRAAYCRAKWIGPGRGFIDPVKEIEAAKMRIEAGISTLEKECAELEGTDWEETLEQRAREIDRMKELGIPLPVAFSNTGQPQQYPSDQPGENDSGSDDDDPETDSQSARTRK